MGNKIIRVIAGIIRRDNGDYLISQRKGGYLDGLWEFPGGKIELGETPEGCLGRELWEEGRVKVVVGNFFHKNVHNYPFGVIELSSYWAEIISGEFESEDHYGSKWVSPWEMLKYPLCPADVPIARKLIALEVLY